MNGLAHAVEALYTTLSNPVARMTALRAASLIRSGLSADEPTRDELALGGLLAGYASGLTGYAFHHVICQTIVRVAGSPHAQTNAVMLPHTVRFMVDRAPEAIDALARALAGGPAAGADAPAAVESLVARTGVRSLADLAVDASLFDSIVDAVAGRGELMNAPDPPDASEVRELLDAAL
jgi:alcohol dehydrogenase class IV